MQFRGTFTPPSKLFQTLIIPLLITPPLLESLRHLGSAAIAAPSKHSTHQDQDLTWCPAGNAAKERESVGFPLHNWQTQREEEGRIILLCQFLLTPGHRVTGEASAHLQGATQAPSHAEGTLLSHLPLSSSRKSTTRGVAKRRTSTPTCSPPAQAIHMAQSRVQGKTEGPGTDTHTCYPTSPRERDTEQGARGSWSAALWRWPLSSPGAAAWLRTVSVVAPLSHTESQAGSDHISTALCCNQHQRHKQGRAEDAPENRQEMVLLHQDHPDLHSWSTAGIPVTQPQ